MSMTEAELSAKISEELENSADEIFGGEGVENPDTEETRDGLQEEQEQASAEEEVKDDAFAKSGDDEEKPSEDDKAEPKKEEEAPADEKKKEGESDKKAEDEKPDDYEIPEDAKGRTRERMEKFVSQLKEKDEQLNQKDEMLGAFKEMLDKTGLDNQELSRVMDIGTMLKYEPEQAYTVLSGVVQNLAKRLGKDFEGVDHLEGHDDLKADVEALRITPEAAKELAVARNQKKQNDHRATQERQQQDQNTKLKQRVETAQAQVSELLKDIQDDIDYEAIAPHMVDAAKFAGKNLAPETWVEYLKGEFSRIKAVSGQARPKSDNNPVVDDSGPKGGDKVPETLEELADQML